MRIRQVIILMLAIVLAITSVPLNNVKAEYLSGEIINTARVKLVGSIALYVGSTQALVNNAQVPVDTTVKSTKPIIRNNRTFVPIRFVSEKLGANVQWNGSTQTVLMKLGDKTIRLRINSYDLVVNNTMHTLDVVPVIIDGRTYVPLRAVSEAFGKYVFYDKRLIVISNSSVFSSVSDANIINEITSWFKQEKFPNYDRNSTVSLSDITRLENSIVAIVGYDDLGQPITQGSGFAVAPGIFATTLDNVQGCESYKIYDSNGTEYDAEGSVAFSEEYNLALLKSSKLYNVPPLTLGSLDFGTKGDSVVTISSPKGIINTLSQGVVSNIHTKDEKSIIQISASLNHGSSGGTVFNMQGEVIGVAIYDYKNSISYAIPSEYLRLVIDKVKDISLNNIPLVELPPIIYSDAKQLTPLHNLKLDFEPTDIVAHPDKPLVYVTSKENKALYKLNIETGEKAKINFEYMPERIAFSNGELYITLLHHPQNYYRSEDEQKGTIAIVDSDSFMVVERFNINQDPFDIAVDNKGYIYVSSATQSGKLVSYSRSSKNIVSTKDIWGGSLIEISPTTNKIYAVTTMLLTSNIGFYTFQDGELLSNEWSPYHGDYDIEKLSKITPNGAFLFNSAGTIFYNTLNYAGDLGYKFKDIVFSENNNEFYTSVDNCVIIVHDYSTFEYKYRFQIDGNADRMFLRDGKLIVLKYVDGSRYIAVYNTIVGQ